MNGTMQHSVIIISWAHVSINKFELDCYYLVIVNINDDLEFTQTIPIPLEKNHSIKMGKNKNSQNQWLKKHPTMSLQRILNQ